MMTFEPRRRELMVLSLALRRGCRPRVTRQVLWLEGLTMHVFECYAVISVPLVSKMEALLPVLLLVREK